MFEGHALQRRITHLILDSCLNSRPAQVTWPSVICTRSNLGAAWDSSWSLGAETLRIFCTWRTQGPSSWDRERDSYQTVLTPRSIISFWFYKDFSLRANKKAESAPVSRQICTVWAEECGQTLLMSGLAILISHLLWALCRTVRLSHSILHCVHMGILMVEQTWDLPQTVK